MRNAFEVSLVFSLVKLFLILLDVGFMHFPHLLDFVKIDNEALLIGMVFFDALPAEYGQMIRTVEVLDPLVMPFAEEALDAILIFEIQFSKNMISFDYLVKDVEIKWQSIS